MDITIETAYFDANESLIDEMRDYFSSLNTYHSELTGIDVYLQYHKERKEEENHMVSVKGFLPGREVFADAYGKDFHEARKSVFNKAKRQLTDFKEQDKDRYKSRPSKPV